MRGGSALAVAAVVRPGLIEVVAALGSVNWAELQMQADGVDAALLAQLDASEAVLGLLEKLSFVPGSRDLMGKSRYRWHILLD